MTHLLSRRLMAGLLIFMLLFVSSISAHAGGSQATTQEPTGVPTSAPTDASQDATQEPTSATVQKDLVFGSGSFNFGEAAAGLADLSGYKATLTLSFDGMKAGQSQKWSKTYVILSMKKPAARQLTIEKTGNLTDLAPVFMADMDGVTYERRGETPCAANVIVPGDSLAERLEPAGFLTGVIGADAAGSETINGVAADHYTFDERALGLSGLVKSTGELWVASTGGYIAKYLLMTKGGADYFGEGIDGTLTWDYELTNINQPVTIKLPQGCPAGLVKAPLLPDATNVLSIPGVLTFDTSTSPADVTAFYQKQMPALGWKVAILPTNPDITGELNFMQGEQLATITIIVDNGTTNVQIVLGSTALLKGFDIPIDPNMLILTKTKIPTRTPVPTRTLAPTRTKVPTRTPVPTHIH